VLPIGIPGMGKTYYAENTIQNVFRGLEIDVEKNLHIIQNDLIRKNLTD